MTERVTGDVETPRSPHIPREHSRHDRLLVTRFAADDAHPDELEHARATIAACPECAALVADIQLLASATAELPAARRTRDFRLSGEQLEGLRGTRLERLLRRIAAPGLAPLRPVAGVALSFGLVLAVAGAAMPPVAVPASAPAETLDMRSQQEHAPAAAPDAVDSQAATPVPGQFMSGEGNENHQDPDARPVPLDRGHSAEDPERLATNDGQAYSRWSPLPPAQDATRSLMVYGGLAVALLSLAVLLLAWFVRRRFHDPLLR